LLYFATGPNFARAVLKLRVEFLWGDNLICFADSFLIFLKQRSLTFQRIVLKTLHHVEKKTQESLGNKLWKTFKRAVKIAFKVSNIVG